MKKKLIISENQYSRIFLLEQSTLENVETLSDKERKSLATFVKNMDDGTNVDKLNKITPKLLPGGAELGRPGRDYLIPHGFGKKLSQSEAEFCKPCTEPLTDDEIIDWWVSKPLSQETINKWGQSDISSIRTDISKIKKTDAEIISKALKGRPACMSCHKFIGPFALTRQDDPEGYDRFVTLINTRNALDRWVYKYRHEILDVLSIVVLIIPVAGPFVSAGIDLANAGMYYSEGEPGMAGFMTVVALIPGAIGAYKLLAGKGLTKGVNSVTKWAIASEESGKKITKDAFETELIKELGNKKFHQNKSLIDNYFNALKNVDKVEAAVKKVVKISEKTPGYWKSFMSNGKAVQKFLKSNDNNIYKAYLAYLKSTAAKEFLIGAGVYTLIMSFGTKLVTFAIDEVPGVKEGLVYWKLWRLEDDADRGNISSIVKLEGFDWNQTKEIFGSDGTEEDNILLKKAWKAGWRPFDEEKMVAITVPEEFHTEIYKEKYKEKLAYDISAQESLERLNNSAIMTDKAFTEGALTQDPSEFNETIGWDL